MTKINENALPMIASCRFGLESVLAQELKLLGAQEVVCKDASVRFVGDLALLARANICLRTAERVFIELKRFKAMSFEELFQGVYSIPWYTYANKNDMFYVKGKTAKSQLHSVSDCQSITKKAIVERMKQRYNVDWFPETGRKYTIEVAMLDDWASILLDASGAGLSRRGYRLHAGEAPLPETIAAGLVLISRWSGRDTLHDPFCGAGTIAIEAAMIAENRAPGLQREFDAEEWGWFPKEIWQQERDKAIDMQKKPLATGSIIATDIDHIVLDAARYNAQQAGISNIVFQKCDFNDLDVRDEYGVVITNPPYGERLLDQNQARNLYKQFGKKMSSAPKWKLSLLTADAEFERYYGKRADKRRKIYNSGIPCQLYQYFKTR